MKPGGWGGAPLTADVTVPLFKLGATIPHPQEAIHAPLLVDPSL